MFVDIQNWGQLLKNKNTKALLLRIIFFGSV